MGSSTLRSFPLLALCAAIGCGGADAPTVVEGTVTYEGKSAPFGTVFFLKSGEPQQPGQISSDGAYSAELAPGEYQVRIDTTPPPPPGHQEGDSIPPQPWPVPQKYANFASSGLTATIGSESPQQVDFTLP
jgi:hypothetical protein